MRSIRIIYKNSKKLESILTLKRVIFPGIDLKEAKNIFEKISLNGHFILNHNADILEAYGLTIGQVYKSLQSQNDFDYIFTDTNFSFKKKFKELIELAFTEDRMDMVNSLSAVYLEHFGKE